ncbi:MAG: CehA/McbA family metallohydrolase [Gemmatimonadaceae bacterium]|nr:CehA/McbA family metallohydrolase [Gemmatimonadaceae bacterium]
MIRRALVALLAVAALPAAAKAQRTLVLPQVREPHPYYWRELYIPQLTSTPSAAAWSPDGRDLVYSMRGTLWRQRVGDDRAVQLTDGGGYDYQPDWSPDGAWIVFSRYTGRAIQLALLDVASGAVRVLLDDGAVHVEPRWSPDGRRLAWVSTAHEGRFHVWVADVGRDTLGTPRRVTEDRDSGLARYYYSRYDQYLSPTWSPDGRELLVVSNRGRLWGSGGLWRLPVPDTIDERIPPTAPRAAAMRLVLDEETMWRARPDWSRDGRIAYASYAGRQWHQLWLTTDAPRRDASGADAPVPLGGEPFQLTYGDGDATSPRWSPDGRRIAYIANDAGAPALRVVDVMGGARIAVTPLRRRWLHAAGVLRLAIVDGATGRALPARASVRLADGRHVAPDDAWMHGDEGFDRAQRAFEFNYFHSDAPVTITLPAGDATIEATHGLEYAHAMRTVAVRAGETTAVRLPLHRIDNLAARGWFSGDLHVHMNYGGAYRNTPARLVRQARAEDVRVVEALIVNKEGRVPDLEHFRGALDGASTRDVALRFDEEFHTSYWGHLALLGLREHVLLPGYAAYANTAARSIAPINADVVDRARAQGAIAGYVHPFDASPDPFDTTRALTNDFPVALALGKIDYYEAVGFVDDLMATQRVWYAALNAGFRVPAGAGTDAMANYASLRGPLGLNRVYARVGAPFTYERFLDAIRRGRTMASNGPLVEFTLAGRSAGDSVVLPAGTHQLRATVRLRSYVAVDSLEIVRNGEVVARLRPGSRGTRADTAVTLAVSESGWYLARAFAARSRHPVLDLQPLGTTSPVYVTVGNRPIRSARDARYFLRWVDRLRANATAFTAWNDLRERDHVIAMLDAARAEWARRAGESVIP